MDAIKRLIDKEIAKLNIGDKVNMGNGEIITIEKFEDDYVYCTTNKGVVEKWYKSVLNRGTIQNMDENIIVCTYCGALRYPEDILIGTIISRNWKDSGYKSPPRAYCKDKGCRGFDQMSHEG